MNTKSVLIIAVAIVIGFSIEPILDRIVPLKESLKFKIIEVVIQEKSN